MNGVNVTLLARDGDPACRYGFGFALEVERDDLARGEIVMLETVALATAVAADVYSPNMSENCAESARTRQERCRPKRLRCKQCRNYRESGRKRNP
jgi:hypothetical protein